MARPAKPWQDRFWGHVIVAGEDECWPWKSALDKDGYGFFQLLHPRVLVRAQRLSFAMHHMEGDPIEALLSLTPDQMVMHSCDNPPCVNPRHLSLGDVLLNNRDKMQKGRFAPWNKGRKATSPIMRQEPSFTHWRDGSEE